MGEKKAYLFANNLNRKILRKLEKHGKNAKEFVTKFQWSKIIENYKKILN